LGPWVRSGSEATRLQEKIFENIFPDSTLIVQIAFQASLVEMIVKEVESMSIGTMGPGRRRLASYCNFNGYLVLPSRRYRLCMNECLPEFDLADGRK